MLSWSRIWKRRGLHRRLPLEELLHEPPNMDPRNRARFMQHRLALTNLQNGIVDPAMPPDIALEMTTWALQVAKSEGAETARQALDLIRYSPTTDGVWAEYRDHLEWTWRHLPELD